MIVLTNESHVGCEMPGVRRCNQKTRMTNFRKLNFNTCHFSPLTFLLFFSPPKSNLSDVSHLFAKVTFLWPLIKVVWLPPSCLLDTSPFVPEFSTLHKSPTSSYVLCKGAKVNHANDHLLCSVWFFPLCKSELSCTCMELVWQRFAHVCQAGKWVLVENNTVCL